MIQIQVTPDELLVDEEFQVSVTGLDPHQKITIHSQITEGKDSFSGVGCYVADDNGHVLCDKHASVAGTFSGVHPMGLIWSMVQSPGQKPGIRLFKKDVSVPQTVYIFAYAGHLDLDQIFALPSLVALASGTVRRWYLVKGVQRVPINTGRIRGTLFIPSGTGPFPAVIDMFGSTGGLLEYKASMLASRGIMALALAYFGFDDLPKDIFEIDITYFREAVTFLANHPKCSPVGVGMMGVSKGGEIIQQVAICCSLVKAVVVINGPTYLSYSCYRDGESVFEDKTTSPFFEPIPMTPEGAIIRGFFPTKSEHALQVHKSKAKFLYIGGMDDQNVPIEIQWFPYLKCPKDQKYRISIATYPGAGHLIEIPYSPCTRASYNRYIGGNTVWGGNPLEHNIAQVDSWQRIQMFFKSTLLNVTQGQLAQRSKL